MAAGAMPAWAMAARAAATPSSVAFTSLRAPPKAPNAVRLAATMQTSETWRPEGPIPARLRLRAARRGLGRDLFLDGDALVLGQRRPGRRRRPQPHLGLQLGERVVGPGARLQRLELLLKRVPGQLPGQLRRGLGLGLDLVDLLAHAIEGVEGAVVRQPAHRVLDGLLSLGPLLPRDQDVLLALGLFDLVVQRAQLVLQLLDGVLLRLPLPLQLQLHLVVLLLARQ